MYRILFVCHGNICRSPMEEYLLKEMLEQRGIIRDGLEGLLSMLKARGVI